MICTKSDWDRLDSTVRRGRVELNQLGVFAKYWEPGRVKTRLAATVGPESASRIYRAFVVTILQRFRQQGDRRVLAYWPPHRISEFQPLAGGDWQLELQQGDDLGARMQHYFDSAFAGGAERVVLIGSDSPHLPPGLIEQAFQLLSSQSVVLGPSYDGGYYLVGAAGQSPPIFDQIQWSTEQVFQQTVQRLVDHNRPFATLPNWEDIDQMADLQSLNRHLQSESLDDPALRVLADALTAELRGTQ